MWQVLYTPRRSKTNGPDGSSHEGLKAEARGSLSQMSLELESNFKTSLGKIVFKSEKMGRD